MEKDIHITKDGSATLYSREHSQHYHSMHGAIQESQHVFINAGLKNVEDKPIIRILEIGFGTGLNALLSGLYAENSVIKYVGIETQPVSLEIVHQLNYAEMIEDKRAYDAFVKLHISPWGEWINIFDGFSIFKIKKRIQDVQLPGLFDLIYYDAFSPDAQPELWSPEIFLKIYHACVVNGVFVTYCARGQVRRDLEDVGFSVERLPGPPGKREMLKAKKIDLSFKKS